MLNARRSMSCLVNPTTNALYVIGGWTGSKGLNSVEKIFIDNMADQHWNYIENLSYAAYWTRAIIHKDNILIISGSYLDEQGTDRYISEIQIINCTNDHVFTGGYLKYKVSSAAVIIVDSTLYTFGGDNEESLNTWQYLDLADTGKPTTVPTGNPISHAKGGSSDQSKSSGVNITVLEYSLLIFGSIIFVLIVVVFGVRFIIKWGKSRDDRNRVLSMQNDYFEIVHSK
eukprot:195253_1